jgi:hypothetical protein
VVGLESGRKYRGKLSRFVGTKESEEREASRAKDEGDELQRCKLQDAEGCGQDATVEAWYP